MWFTREGLDGRPWGRDSAKDRPERTVRTCAEPRGAGPRRYLTDDEIARIAPCDEVCSFRLRIWRGRDCPAVVLVSQLPGGPSPSWSSSQAANLIHRAYLGFPAEGMLYFEDEVVLGERAIFSVEFVAFAHGLRRCFTWPIRRAFAWEELEILVGGPLPH